MLDGCQWLCHAVCDHLRGWDEDNGDFATVHLLANKVMLDINMLCALVILGILSERKTTLIVPIKLSGDMFLSIIV
jgi:hypothetical protein